MSAHIEAWIIRARGTGRAPRATDDPTFPWAWDEAIALLPGDATPAERAAALSAVVQTSHFASGDRSDVEQFVDRLSYFSSQVQGAHVDALHPYLEAIPARNLRYVQASAGEVRGHFDYDVIPASEL
ncbi:hypothetical protein [Microbacterium sp.]|jgi:hypothetical protein|uniref:hypothetical protein n=1 Tax=Microbacterium sp. TaxID=51671 RepID=UPI0037C92F0B